MRTIAVCALWVVCGTLCAGDSLYVSKASTWRYAPGIQEASLPDTAAWRAPAFDDAAWADGPAPFGFGESPLGTDLSTFDPPMRRNYTCLYLRQGFEISDPARVIGLYADVDYDDGFVMWINGREVLRVNVAGNRGDPVSFEDVADASHESGDYELFELPDPTDYLVGGTNVVAVQAFNQSLSGSDFLFDVQIVDPSGSDATAPRLASVVPSPGMTVASLSWCDVTFSEVVSGIDAGDLRINGVAATAVTGEGAGPYTFTFVPVAAGPVDVSWAAGHGIEDSASPPFVFGGNPWSYVVDPDVPSPAVRINEFLAANREGLVDEVGEAEDWVELYNDGDHPVSLAGWSLSDTALDPGKWVFPDVSIPSKGSLIVFCCSVRK